MSPGILVIEINATNLVKPSGMMRVAIDLRNILGHDSQLGIVCANLNVEELHIVWRALPPIFGVAGSVIHITDSRGLSVLRTSRPIKVETIHPDTSAVKHFSAVVLTKRLSGIRKMEIQVSGGPGNEHELQEYTLSEKFNRT